MSFRRLLIVSMSVLIAVVLVLIYLFLEFETTPGRAKMVQEIEKGLIQLALIAVIGGLVGLFFNRYQQAQAQALKDRDDARQREQAMLAFQADKLRRVVEVANTLRRAPALIEAHRSAKTYGEQTRAAIDSRLDLHRLNHEISSFGPPDKNTAFPSWQGISTNLEAMSRYLLDLEKEFRSTYKKLSELQRVAEKDRGQQSIVWEQIQLLPMIRDLLGTDVASAEQTKFAQQFLGPYRDVVTLMQRDLAQRQRLI